MDGRATELLQAAGFQPMVNGYVLKLGDEDYERIIVLDAASGGTVSDATTAFLALRPQSNPGGYDLVLESEDVRDMVALGVAAENSRTFDVNGDEVALERGFVYDHTFIHNPFADRQYGDWEGKPGEGPNGRAYRLKSPAKREWANEYIAWRDTYCANLLAPAASPKA